MKPNCRSTISLNFSIVPQRNPLFVSFPIQRLASPSPISIQFISSRPTRFLPIWCSNSTKKSNSVDRVSSNSTEVVEVDDGNEKLSVEVGNPIVPSVFKSWTQLSLSDQAFFLLSFIACTTSVAFTSLVVAAVPTLFAMGRAATSLSKLADTAREELPSTMAAIRLSGMEISDLTLELSDLSQEIADGVNKSAQAVQAAEAGIRQFGALAHQHTVSMIQERANLPTISIQPVVTGAAKKTSQAVGRATKSLMNFISGGEARWDDEEDSGIDRLEI